MKILKKALAMVTFLAVVAVGASAQTSDPQSDAIASALDTVGHPGASLIFRGFIMNGSDLRTALEHALADTNPAVLQLCLAVVDAAHAEGFKDGQASVEVKDPVDDDTDSESSFGDAAQQRPDPALVVDWQGPILVQRQRC